MYKIYNTRMSGWLSKQSNYTSVVDDARIFSQEDAFTLCRMNKTHAGLNAIPVRIEDIEAL